MSTSLNNNYAKDDVILYRRNCIWTYIENEYREYDRRGKKLK